MSEEDIIQGLRLRPGQSQTDRASEALGPHHADIDERTPEDLLLFARELAQVLRFQRLDQALLPGTWDPTDTWQPFFNYDKREAAQLLTRADGAVSPHLALFATFLFLHETHRAVLNRITGGHLGFFYEQVLGFVRRPAIPDRAHLLLELKKGAGPGTVALDQDFTGKGAPSGDVTYRPTREIVVNAGKVDGLSSVFVDGRGGGTVRFGPVANSSDGLGPEFEEDEPWSAFGHDGLAPAQIGFAFASPVLRMKEGRRTITVEVGTAGIDRGKLAELLNGLALDAFLTGEKAWIPASRVEASLSTGPLVVTVDLATDAAAVVDYDPRIHGHAFATKAPVVQFLLGGAETTATGYLDLAGLIVSDARITVEVTGTTDLVLENDTGPLDPKKAFLPFGPQPVKGSRFMIGHREALSKKLESLDLHLGWHGAPTDFSQHYRLYDLGINEDYFTAAVSAHDGGSWNVVADVPLFAGRNSDGVRALHFTPASTSASGAKSHDARIRALIDTGTDWGRRAADKAILAKPVLESARATQTAPPTGFVHLTLKQAVPFETFRRITIAKVVAAAQAGTTPDLPSEPYVPAIRTISLSYAATTDRVPIGSAQLDDATNQDVEFFHIGCFGQMRENGYQRAQFEFVPDKRVSLFPRYESGHDFFVGLTGVGAGDSTTLLFQCAEGSADPDSHPQAIRWSVLCDNYWRPLASDQVFGDTTAHLRTSGVITFVFPREVTTSNTIMPAGRVWLRGSLAGDPGAACRLVTVAANAVEVEFWAASKPEAHFLGALPEGTINALHPPIGGVKAVRQPYASFGGRATETADSLRTRASERLRHKNRAVSAFDYERLVLDRFPGVHTVKCIQHSSTGSWLAPGHVLVIVIPDLRNRNAVDPLEPKVDAGTIDAISAFLQTRAGMGVKLRVRNPTYQRIHIDATVRFKPGREFNLHRTRLEHDLVRYLSPWAFASTATIAFGGRVYPSLILDFIEELDYVDYLTDLKLKASNGPGGQLVEVRDVRAENPDAILVSDRRHSIAEAP